MRDCKYIVEISKENKELTGKLFNKKKGVKTYEIIKCYKKKN